MKKQSFKELLREWDEGSFDLTERTIGELHPEEKLQNGADSTWAEQPITKVYNREMNIFRSLFPVIAVILAVVITGFLMVAISDIPDFGSPDSPVFSSTTRYIRKGLAETGAVNLVAGVILDYRAFDTLGESHVLFTASVVVFILLLQSHPEKEKRRDSLIMRNDLVLKKTAKVLIPLLVMFGLYVILNGHLGPGGGFSGGTIIGSAFILFSLAYGPEAVSPVINMKVYRRVVLCALLFYSLSKCYSFFCGANGYETIFTTGTPGAIFSAGLILPLNCAVGLVVACTMYGFYAIFTQGRP